MRNTLYPYVDDVMKNNTCIALDDGSNNVFHVELGTLRLVYKSLFSPKAHGFIKSTLKRLDEPLKNYYAGKLGSNYSIRGMHGETLDIECRVLDEWKKRNIPCITILERQDKALVYAHLNSLNFSKLLRNGGNYRHQYQQLLDITDAIRSTAKKENNPMLLHPDLLPKNFLYVFETDSVIAIDPGIKLKDLPLAELDARINLMFVQDLNIYENGDYYVDGFLDTLTKEEQKRMRELNDPVRPDVILYFKTKEELLRMWKGTQKRSWLERYSPKNITHLNNLLDKHIG